MLSRRQKPHGARLLFAGAWMALLGLALSVSIVILKFPRPREVCTKWSTPGRFTPITFNHHNVLGATQIPRVMLEGDKISKNQFIQQFGEMTLLQELSSPEGELANETIEKQSLKMLQKAIDKPKQQYVFRRLRNTNTTERKKGRKRHSEDSSNGRQLNLLLTPLNPFLFNSSLNAFDELAVDKWILESSCVRPMVLDSTTQNDPVSQRVIRRVSYDGVLVTFCCQATELEMFFPPTISESIRDWSAPEGRIFFGFMIVASVLVLMSAHPYSLSNVCSAHDEAFGLVNTAWLRNYFPPIGLMLVACVPTVPVDVMYSLSPTVDEVIINLLMFSVHMVGAIGAFVGYALAEVWALNILPQCIDPIDDEINDISDIVFHKQLICGYQRAFRIAAVFIILAGCGVFSTGFTIVMFAGAQRYFAMSEGFVLFWRVTTYLGEAAAAAGLGISLMVIWFYCPERHVSLLIERDLMVLTRFVTYLEGYGGLSQPLADQLKLKIGSPEREKVERLEREAYQQFQERRDLLENCDAKPNYPNPFEDSIIEKKMKSLFGTSQFQGTSGTLQSCRSMGEVRAENACLLHNDSLKNV